MDTAKDMITGIKISEFDRQSISVRLSEEFDFLGEFRRFDPDEVDEAKRETLRAIELATILG